jgi:hypothetical protein
MEFDPALLEGIFGDVAAGASSGAATGWPVAAASAAPMVSPYPAGGAALPAGGGAGSYLQMLGMGGGSGGSSASTPTVTQGGLASQQPGAGLSSTLQNPSSQYVAPTWTGGGGGSSGIAQAGEPC